SHIAYDFVFQEEKGESGTPHLQGVVSLKHRMRWTEFGLPKSIHWEKVKMVHLCYEYCSNPMKRFGKCYSLKWKIPPIIKILQQCDFYPWQTRVIEFIGEEPDDRTICWVWSEKGKMGKSTFCKYLCFHHKAIICGKGTYANIINIAYNADLSEQSLVVFDLPRNNGNKISYSALEAIKNGIVCNTKYETGSKIFNPPHIIVFSNAEPDYESMSADKWNVINVD
uniref:hypothetical protein n=1 Tax=Yoonia sp. TaxID=2212373 RepID=UPI004047D75C